MLESLIIKADILSSRLPVSRQGRRFLYFSYVFALVGVFILSLNLLIQLFYPTSYSRPLVEVNGQHLGLSKYQAIAASMSKFSNEELIINTNTKTFKQSYAQAGLIIDADKTAALVLEYPFSERLKPFSILRKQRIRPLVSHNKDKLHSLSIAIAKNSSMQPENASVIKKSDNSFEIVGDKKGYAFHPEQIKNRIVAIDNFDDREIDIQGTEISAKITSRDLQSKIEQINKITKSSLKVKVTGTEHEVNFSNKDLKNIMNVGVNHDKSSVEIIYDQQLIKEKVQNLAQRVDASASYTVVHLVDGQQVSVVHGQPGRRIDLEAGVKEVIKSLEENKPEVNLAIQTLPAPVRYESSFTKSSAGLSAILAEWLRATGLDAAVIIKEVDGQNRYAEHQPDKKYIAASLYKLFTAYFLYDGLEKGSLNSEQKIGIDISLGECLELMIVVSNNTCPRAISNTLGWETIFAKANATGFSNSYRDASGIYTTARDITYFFEKLNNGSLLGETFTARLLDNLKRQIYREGLPSASKGTVANKVGYVDGYRHDAGIIYGPKSTYILTIVTYGGNYTQVKQLAQKVDAFFND